MKRTASVCTFDGADAEHHAGQMVVHRIEIERDAIGIAHRRRASTRRRPICAVLAVEETHADVERAVVVEHADFGALGRRLAFVRIDLREVGHDLRLRPASSFSCPSIAAGVPCGWRGTRGWRPDLLRLRRDSPRRVRRRVTSGRAATVPGRGQPPSIWQACGRRYARWMPETLKNVLVAVYCPPLERSSPMKILTARHRSCVAIVVWYCRRSGAGAEPAAGSDAETGKSDAEPAGSGDRGFRGAGSVSARRARRRGQPRADDGAGERGQHRSLRSRRRGSIGTAFNPPPGAKIWNPVKLKMLQGGKVTGGTLFSATDPATYCAMAEAGYDFIWTEMQHDQRDWDQAALMWRTCPHAGAVPGVRVARAEEREIQHALDAGALVIVVPDDRHGRGSDRSAQLDLLPSARPAKRRRWTGVRADDVGTRARRLSQHDQRQRRAHPDDRDARGR